MFCRFFYLAHFGRVSQIFSTPIQENFPPVPFDTPLPLSHLERQPKHSKPMGYTRNSTGLVRMVAGYQFTLQEISRALGFAWKEIFSH